MTISQDDLLVFQKAVNELNKANAILQFLSNHFRDKYNLQPGDTITPVGQIVSSQGNMFDNWTTNENGTSLDGAENVPLQTR